MSDHNDILHLDQAWIYQVSVLADKVARRSSAIAKAEAGLNLSQWRVLAALADRPGRSAREVVDVTPMDKGLVSRACASLIDKGLAEKVASETDGRVSHLYLSAKGREIYLRIVKKMRHSGADGQACLNATARAEFLHMLKAVGRDYSAD